MRAWNDAAEREMARRETGRRWVREWERGEREGKRSRLMKGTDGAGGETPGRIGERGE